MFDRELWYEIWVTIKKNKLRTFLTGFSVAWGIFMVTILLGAGTGVRNAAKYSFMKDADDLIQVFPGRISKPYKGLEEGRRIVMNTRSLEIIDHKVDNVIKLNPILDISGSVKYKKNIFGHYSIMGVSPLYQEIEKLDVPHGRFLNKLDINDGRKVAVIGTKVAEQLFDHANPLGKTIDIKEMPFLVVGVYDSEFLDDRERENIYLPFTLVQNVYKKNNDISYASLLVDKENGGDAHQVEKSIRKLMAGFHQFDPTDNNALWIRNKAASQEEVGIVFAYLQAFIWFISAGSILAGAIGVSNIMIIVVKERTKEFGVRKAIGASPASIVSLILTEAVSITLVAGIIGLIFGAIGVDLISNYVGANEGFRDPSVDWNIAITTVLVLVSIGAFAGFIPAKRAASIKPVEALRAE